MTDGLEHDLSILVRAFTDRIKNLNLEESEHGRPPVVNSVAQIIIRNALHHAMKNCRGKINIDLELALLRVFTDLDI